MKSAATPATPPSLRSLLHELQVHQIELAQQNEELRGVQTELEAQRDAYFELYELAPVGYCTLNYQGQIQQANLSTANLLGLPRSALLGRPMSVLVAKEDQEIYYQLRQQLYQSGQPQSGNLRMHRRDDTPLWVHWACSLAPARAGERHWSLILTDITELQEARQALQASYLTLLAQDQSKHRDLQALTLELTYVEQRERQALAQELHDNLAQLLVAIKIKLAILAAKPGTALISEIDTLLDTANHSLRLLIHEISPAVLLAQGLHAAWTELFKVLHSSYGLSVHMQSYSEPQQLGPEQLPLIYRGVRELLINVAKHAGVKRAAVSCMVTQERMVVAVSDEGCGFDASQPLANPDPSRFGLQSLRRRLQALQGSLDIDTAPGKGCTVVLTLPLADNTRAPAGYLDRRKPK